MTFLGLGLDPQILGATMLLTFLGGVAWLLQPDKGESWKHFTHLDRMLSAGRHLGTSVILGFLVALDFASQGIHPLGSTALAVGVTFQGYAATEILRNLLNRGRAGGAGRGR